MRPRYWLLLSVIWGLIYSARFVLPYDPTYLGSDGTIHAYYGNLLFNQLAQGSPSAGRWDPHLYNGWGFLSLYPPLFSVLVALLTFLTPFAEKILLLALFPMISLASYITCKRIFKDPHLGFVGSIAMLSVSAVPAVLTINGTPDYLLTFLFGISALGFLWKPRITDILIASVFLALLALSHLDNWLILLPYLLVFIMSQSQPRRMKMISLSALPLSFLFSVFYVLPAGSYFSANISSIYAPLAFQTSPLLYLVSPSLQGVGLLDIALIAVAAIFFVRHHEKEFLPFFLVASIAIVAFFLQTGSPLVDHLFVGKSGVYPLTLMAPFLACYLLYRLNPDFSILVQIAKRVQKIPSRGIITAILVILALTSAQMMPIYAGSQQQYSDLYTAAQQVRQMGILHPYNLLKFGSWESVNGSWTVGTNTIVGRNTTENTVLWFKPQKDIENFSISASFNAISNQSTIYGGLVLIGTNGTGILARWLAPFGVFKVETTSYTPISSIGVSLPLEISISNWNNSLSIIVNGKALPSMELGGIRQFGFTIYRGEGAFTNVTALGYSFIHAQSRMSIVLIPRSPIIGYVTLLANATSPDGWFSQGSPPKLANAIHAAIDIDSWNDTKSCLAILRGLGVNYILFDESIYYFPTAGKERLILQNLLSDARLVYSKGEVYIFALS